MSRVLRLTRFPQALHVVDDPDAADDSNQHEEQLEEK